jgi:hypothetical protein
MAFDSALTVAGSWKSSLPELCCHICLKSESFLVRALKSTVSYQGRINLHDSTAEDDKKIVGALRRYGAFEQSEGSLK